MSCSLIRSLPTCSPPRPGGHRCQRIWSGRCWCSRNCSTCPTRRPRTRCATIRWKVACGRSLTQASFDPSTLVYWRRRIAASDRPDRVFDAVAQVIAETGILRGRRKRCVDSTVFDDAVATQDTVIQLVAAMRKVARLVPGAQSVIERVAQRDYSKPGKPDIDWDDADAKQNLVSDLVTDALAVLAELCGEDAPHREEPAADALGLLALVAGQDVEGTERGRISRLTTGRAARSGISKGTGASSQNSAARTNLRRMCSLPLKNRVLVYSRSPFR